MHYDKEIYRPPREAYTPLLQVTSGCSHNACLFCGMYRKTPYRLSPTEEIREDLKEIRYRKPNADRIYLLNGDPFSMKTERLLEISRMIREYLPDIKIITMYASIRNIMEKIDEELKALKEALIDELYIGIESGHDKILKDINKGNTKEEAVKEVLRLEKAGINWKAMIMLGIGGKGSYRENALETADLFSKVSPRGIFCLSTTLVPGTPLFNKMNKGEFEEASEYERILETRILIENIKPRKKVRFNSVHVSNTLTIDGFLPEDKDRLLEECDKILKNYTEEEFQKEFDRHGLTNL